MQKVIFAIVIAVVTASALEIKPMKPIVLDDSQPKEINGQIVWVVAN